MSTPPFPVTSKDVDGIKKQVTELMRVVYEENIGGATVGDVFKVDNNVLELQVGAGFRKVGNKLDVNRNHKCIQNMGGSLQTIGHTGSLTFISSLTESGGGLASHTRTITIGNGLITNVGAET